MMFLAAITVTTTTMFIQAVKWMVVTNHLKSMKRHFCSRLMMKKMFFLQNNSNFSPNLFVLPFECEHICMFVFVTHLLQYFIIQYLMRKSRLLIWYLTGALCPVFHVTQFYCLKYKYTYFLPWLKPKKCLNVELLTFCCVTVKNAVMRIWYIFLPQGFKQGFIVVF